MKMNLQNALRTLTAVTLLAFTTLAISASLSLESVSEDGFDPNKARQTRENAATKAGLMAAIMRAEAEPSEAQLDAEWERESADRLKHSESHSMREPRQRVPSARHEGSDDIERAFGKRSSERYVLRCWQEGRLILQRDLARMPQLARTGVQLEDSDGVSLQLFDLQNATCMVQQR
jgi:hypothetical protein